VNRFLWGISLPDGHLVPAQVVANKNYSQHRNLIMRLSLHTAKSWQAPPVAKPGTGQVGKRIDSQSGVRGLWQDLMRERLGRT
jgi:hypothetical protein